MTTTDMRRLLEDLRAGRTDIDTVQAHLVETMRAAPFEDLGFARVDHHRALRKGFPEVIFGMGKTPAQTAAIAVRIVARNQTLMVTRATADTFDAVRAVVPDARRRGRRGKATPVVSRVTSACLPVCSRAARPL